jgi:CheY-like chemotaxis protein
MQILKPIMLIEDDSVDAMTVKRAMKELHVTNSMVHCLNGEEGLKYLTDPETEKPFVILLDLNMPKMSGLEFLKSIKVYPELKRIPVVVLTTSKERRDVLDSFELGAAGYMIKPVDYAKFTEVINTVMLYWQLSELPRQELKLADAEK